MRSFALLFKFSNSLELKYHYYQSHSQIAQVDWKVSVG